MSGEPDNILGKADALMRRHRSFVAGAAASDDEVPVLTDEVIIDAEEAPAPDDGAAPGAARLGESTRELLAYLEPDIIAAVQAWLAAELPHMVARELGALGPRLIETAHQSMREALLPELRRLLESRAEVGNKQ